LFNKRALTELGQQKVRSATRFKKPLSLLVCDLDHFKDVNDTHGHDVGDLVIRGFADVLRRVKRDTDAVGRFGGEEFVVVCEETDEAGAALLAERVRAELESTTFHTERGPLQVTCSIGIAPFPAAGATWESLFKATDEALYASKRGGRNRATVWPRSRTHTHQYPVASARGYPAGGTRLTRQPLPAVGYSGVLNSSSVLSAAPPFQGHCTRVPIACQRG
jgi:diguanylate cyclase (GGDEF)-like protein